MSEKIAPRERDFSQWYQDVVLQSQLADYSPVKGCMVIRPNGYSIWERLQRNLNDRIAAQGVRNAYFPLFIPESFIKKEAEHVEGFAPQLAVVTHAGGKELEEALVVRPTSETVINSMFAKWIQSYRDLPLLINQWANVVRWEMRTRLFLRTTEFLWQEGHTCHSTAEEAEMFTRRMLGVYRDFAHEVLCMPVYWGRKTDSERFAGALRTYCIEAMMQDKKALQAGTSHNLSTHFAKAFETKFLDTDNTQKLVHQTSWGVSTRLIGGLVMTHSDDKGLVLPPMLAETHVRIVPMFGKAGDAGAKPKVIAAVESLIQAIQSETRGQLPYTVGVNADMDDSKQAGWKFHEAELLGIPLRIDLGPRDLEKGEAVLVRRDRPEKQSVPIKDLPARVVKELKAMQKDLLASATKFRNDNTFVAQTYAELKDGIASGRGFAVSPYCNGGTCEAKIKEETKATVRCLSLNDAYETKPGAGPCVVCGKSPTVEAVIALAY